MRLTNTPGDYPLQVLQEFQSLHYELIQYFLPMCNGSTPTLFFLRSFYLRSVTGIPVIHVSLKLISFFFFLDNTEHESFDYFYSTQCSTTRNTGINSPVSFSLTFLTPSVIYLTSCPPFSNLNIQRVRVSDVCGGGNKFFREVTMSNV